MKTGRRTLKKVLGLVLCLAMMLSIMVVGAGAAFADQSDIDTKHTEAVDMCNALNIITGFENGKFMPKDNVTREQMAKMICVLDNGGKEPQLSAGTTFSDVALDRWSNKYIESCAARGIVVGVGGGKFAPAGKVTATQAAKMLLVELGYDDDIQKYSGSDWATKVNVDATKKGYYEDLEDIDVNAPLTREHAAQMIWNALQATEVEYSYTLVTNPDGSISSKVTVSDKFEDKDGKNGLTLLEDKYGAVDTDKTTGILTGIKYNTTKKEYTYTITNAPGDKTALENGGKYTTDKDYTALLGHNVSFVVKDDKDNTVFGAFTDDSKVVVSGLYGDIDFADFNKGDNSIEVNDTDYDTDKDIYKEVAIYSDDGHEAGYVSLTEYRDAKEDVVPLDYFEYSAIDWDDDDDIDLIIVTPVAFGEITYVASDYVRVAESDATGWTATALFSDKLNTEKDTQYNVYSGAAKEDYALISFDKSLKTEGTVTLLEKQTGKVVSTTKDTAVIGDATYDITYKADLKTFRDKSVDFRTINDYVVWSKNSSSVDTSDYLLITGITSGTNAKGYYEATVLFTDNTTDTVNIKSAGSIEKGIESGDNAYSKIPDTVKAGSLWKYEISKGNYELTALETPTSGKVDTADEHNEEFDLWLVDANNTLSDGSTTSHWSAATKAADADAKVIFENSDSVTNARTAKFASDAVVFVDDGDDYTVKTGADLAKVTGKAAVRYAGAEENDNGYNNVTFAYISTKSVSSGDTIYGFVTSDVTVSETSKEGYFSFTAWNGEEYAELTTVDVYGDTFEGSNLTSNQSGKTINANVVNAVSDGGATANLKAKAIIAYKLDADGNVTNLTVLDAKYGALTGWDGDDIKVITNEDGYGEYTTDKDDTSFLYIDVSDKTGDKTGNYSKADEVKAADLDKDMKTIIDGDKTYYANVMIVGEAGKDLDLVVVTIDNRWNGIASVSFKNETYTWNTSYTHVIEASPVPAGNDMLIKITQTGAAGRSIPFAGGTFTFDMGNGNVLSADSNSSGNVLYFTYLTDPTDAGSVLTGTLLQNGTSYRATEG